MTDLTDQLYEEVNTFMGGTGIEVELEQADYDVALDSAVRKYRSMSRNAVEFGWLFLELTPGTQKYTIRHDIDAVLDLRRTRTGIIVGSEFEPFSAAFIQNTLGSLGGSEHGIYGLFTYEAVSHYQELVGRLFGEFIMYSFEPHNHELYIWRMPRSDETVGMEVSIVKPISALLRDGWSYRWIREWTKAECMVILGEKYSKFATQVGAQGGTVLKGDRLVSDAKEMKVALDQELYDYQDGGEGVIPLIG